MELIFGIFEVAATYIESYLLLVLSGILFKENTTKEEKRKEWIIAGIDTIIVTVLNSIQIVSVLSLIALPAFAVVMQKIILKRKVLRCIMIATVYMAVLVILDFVSVYLFMLTTHMDMNSLINNGGFKRLLCMIFSKGLLIVSVEIVKYFSIDLRGEFLKKNVLEVLCIIVFSGLPLIAGVFYNDTYDWGVGYFCLGFSWIMGMVILFKYIVISKAQYQQEITLQIQNAKNETLEQSLSELEQSFLMWKTSVHDYKHSILYMRTLMEENRLQDLKNFLDMETDKLSQSANYYKTGNSMIDVIVNTKYKVLQEKNIYFMFHADVSDNFSIEELDLGVLIGNLMDNAIEAAQQCKEPVISLTIETRHDLFYLKIQNSFSGKLPDFQTTKENKVLHGVGMKSIERIVEKYEGDIQRKANKNKVTIVIELLCDR